ncbi:MAG: ABC transporter ATP-binding protein [Syntrophales bacterium LBB04]|nr:ABC transporter ATP-binding protein [Syntrophales bacterium LBB04]
MEPLIRADKIGYRYNHQWVIRGITFEVAQGELIGLIGPNGSGKTTLLKCLDRLLVPQEGRILWEGQSLTHFSQNEIARNMALVSQETTLIFAPTVQETVLMGRYPYLNRFQLEGTKDYRLAEAAMDRTQIRHLERRSLTELSSGERQRVYLARALCQEPKVLLLDEPTAFLDIQHQVGILDLISNLNLQKELTILVASHDINLTAQYCQRLIVIRQGQIETIGPPDQVIKEEIIEKVFKTRVVVDENPFTKTPRITLLGERERHA